ncbi:MAG: ribosome recycling factor [Candidatus Margulisiibacteriota bacterium]
MQELKEQIEKAIANTKRNLATLRTGRANPDLLARIQVDYYGSMVPLKQVAAISVPESTTLMLNVFDRSAIQAVERAIHTSDLGLSPRVEGQTVILKLPQLTEDRRKELVKIARKTGEEGKVALRNYRRDALERIKKDKDAPEDQQKKLQDQVQKTVDDAVSQIDKLVLDKETEISHI